MLGNDWNLIYGYHLSRGFGHCHAAWLAALDLLEGWTRRVGCRMIGHTWLGCGWAGPESGGDGATCTRCGESWEVTFY